MRRAIGYFVTIVACALAGSAPAVAACDCKQPVGQSCVFQCSGIGSGGGTGGISTFRQTDSLKPLERAIRDGAVGEKRF